MSKTDRQLLPSPLQFKKIYSHLTLPLLLRGIYYPPSLPLPSCLQLQFLPMPRLFPTPLRITNPSLVVFSDVLEPTCNCEYPIPGTKHSTALMPGGQTGSLWNITPTPTPPSGTVNSMWTSTPPPSPPDLLLLLDC